jgi:hypothetical protein
MPDDFLGIHWRTFLIGVQGGFSGVFVLRDRVKVRDLLSHGIVGGFSANYCGSTVDAILSSILDRFHLGTNLTLSGFIAGAIGMSLLHLAIAFVESWDPSKRLKND